MILIEFLGFRICKGKIGSRIKSRVLFNDLDTIPAMKLNKYICYMFVRNPWCASPYLPGFCFSRNYKTRIGNRNAANHKNNTVVLCYSDILCKGSNAVASAGTIVIVPAYSCCHPSKSTTAKYYTLSSKYAQYSGSPICRLVNVAKLRSHIYCILRTFFVITL